MLMENLMKPRKLLIMSILYMNFVPGPTQKPSSSKAPHWRMRSKKNQKNHIKLLAKSLRIVLPEHQRKILLRDLRETLLKNPRNTLMKNSRKFLPTNLRKNSMMESGAISTLHAVFVDTNVNIEHNIRPVITISSLSHYRQVTEDALTMHAIGLV
jgi:hypothetical protein